MLQRPLPCLSEGNTHIMFLLSTDHENVANAFSTSRSPDVAAIVCQRCHMPGRERRLFCTPFFRHDHSAASSPCRPQDVRLRLSRGARRGWLERAAMPACRRCPRSMPMPPTGAARRRATSPPTMIRHALPPAIRPTRHLSFDAQFATSAKRMRAAI